MAEPRKHPWIAGIVDTLAGAAVLRDTQIPHRNRLAVILIDSAFETACRAYLRHVAKIKLDESHRHREHLVKTVRAKLSGIEDGVWDSINFYYSEIRNDFYHVSAGKTITDTAILDYLDTVEFVIDAAFGTKVGQLVREASPNPVVPSVVDQSAPAAKPLPRLTELSDPIDKVVVAVASAKPKGVDEINEYFKKQGDKLRLKPDQLTNILARNSGSKKFFYFSRESKAWGLSALGEFKLTQLTEGPVNGN